MFWKLLKGASKGKNIMFCQDVLSQELPQSKFQNINTNNTKLAIHSAWSNVKRKYANNDEKAHMWNCSFIFV